MMQWLSATGSRIAYRTVLILLAVLCCEMAVPVVGSLILPPETVSPLHTAYAAAKKKKKKNTKRSKRRKKKRRARAVLPKPFLKDVTYDSTLAPGVKYSKMITGGGKYSVHVITVDYDEIDDNIRVEVLKGHERFNGLEKIVDIASRRDSIGPDSVLGAVNANFWKAYYNTPINPTVIDGEVLEMDQHKQWSSAFFDRDGKVYIDRFVIQGTVRTRKGREWSIASMNTRHQDNGVVVYNSFSGDTIPYVKPVSPEELAKETLDNFTIAEYDSTETAPTLEAVLRAASEKKREEQIEYGMRKARVRYLGTPRVNQRLHCVVLGLDTGTVILPQNGAVVSFGRDIPESELPRRGDTLALMFTTNIHDKVPFEFAVGGTPRLVRNGRAAHEASIEGSTARRFISGNLSRTALGVDKTNSVLYLVAVDGTHRGNGTRGMTLAELAVVMRDLGAYNAMNLDGGGSVSMVVGGENVVRIGGGEFNRRISVALGVVKKNARPVAGRTPASRPTAGQAEKAATTARAEDLRGGDASQSPPLRMQVDPDRTDVQVPETPKTQTREEQVRQETERRRRQEAEQRRRQQERRNQVNRR